MRSKSQRLKQSQINKNENKKKVMKEDNKEEDVEVHIETSNQSEPVSDKLDIPATVEAIKHPLEHTWSFWLQDIDNKKTWEENLVELTTFNTVEDFWCLYHHIKLPSELEIGQDYGIFKKGIRPMWEDKANARGGRLLILVDKRNLQLLDRLWLDTVLLMIGENFEDNDIINGAVINIRVKHKVGIWTKNASNMQAILRIEGMLKNVLGIKWKLDYLPHDKSQANKH